MKQSEKTSTGIPGLDNMLHGGLIPHRPYIVSGCPGTGKTTLCMQFLLEGLKGRENVLYVTVEIPPNEIKDNMKSFGWDISEIKILDATSDIRRLEPTPIVEISTDKKVQKMAEISEIIRKTPEFESFVVSIHSLQQMLRNETIKVKYDRIVLDSITGVKFFCMEGFDICTGIQSFVRFLSELKSTVLLVVETPETVKLEPEMFLARGDIRLYKWFENYRLKRCIGIESYKGSRHDETLRVFEITDDGIVVYGENNRCTEEVGKPAAKESKPSKVPIKSETTHALTYRQQQLLDQILDIVASIELKLDENTLPQFETSKIRASLLEIMDYIDSRNFTKALELVNQCDSVLQEKLTKYSKPVIESIPTENTNKEIVFEEKVETVMTIDTDQAQEVVAQSPKDKKWFFFKKKKEDKGEKKRFKLFG